MRHRIISAMASAAVLLTGFLTLGHARDASAAWVTTSAPAPATAAAAAIPAGPKPTVTGINLGLAATYTVTWPAVAMTNGLPVTGYIVTRTSSDGTVSALGAGTCTGLTLLGLGAVKAVPHGTGATESCTEISLLSSGTPRYQITPVTGSWRGTPSDWGTI